VLAVAGCLLVKLVALEQAFLELDTANVIFGDRTSAPPSTA
jgi:hypothetical protein